MAFTITNLVTNSNLSLGTIQVPANGTASTDFLTKEVLVALAANQISISPTLAAAEPTPVAMTIAVGVPAAACVDVGAAFSQAVLNANFATLATVFNSMALAIGALQAQVRSHESRLDKTTSA